MHESTFAITESGLLCEFNGRRLLDKWVELRTTRAACLSVGSNLICIGCAEGIIRVFNPSNLHFICTLPRPHALGTDLGRVVPRPEAPSLSRTKYADTVAIALIEDSKKVTCVYNDRSMYVWDVRDFKKVGKTQSYLYHSACIWGIEVSGALLIHDLVSNCVPPTAIPVCERITATPTPGHVPHVFQRRHDPGVELGVQSEL